MLGAEGLAGSPKNRSLSPPRPEERSMLRSKSKERLLHNSKTMQSVLVKDWGDEKHPAFPLRNLLSGGIGILSVLPPPIPLSGLQYPTVITEPLLLPPNFSQELRIYINMYISIFSCL
ncbi:UNVERIFIED_CONTAM: hypothetical protein K2H54_033130 [Gekko kuhli]